MKQQNILVVGASKGIGQALAQQLAKEGANVYAAARNKDSTANYPFITYDALKDDPEEVFSDLPETLDGLVYCPGSINLKPFHRIKTEDFIADYEVNVIGAVRLMQAMMKRLKKSETASVVLFSTVAVGVGMPFHASIAAAKGGLEALVRSVAAEWAAASIRVNAIAPSLTDTDLAAKLLNTDAKQESAAKRHPLGRVGTPEDQAALAAFLLSSQASWISGQVIGVDGGLGKLKV
jgi:3-oxoacyl-[acyl-carrier protein] reductase